MDDETSPAVGSSAKSPSRDDQRKAAEKAKTSPMMLKPLYVKSKSERLAERFLASIDPTGHTTSAVRGGRGTGVGGKQTAAEVTREEEAATTKQRQLVEQSQAIRGWKRQTVANRREAAFLSSLGTIHDEQPAQPHIGTLQGNARIFFGMYGEQTSSMRRLNAAFTPWSATTSSIILEDSTINQPIEIKAAMLAVAIPAEGGHIRTQFRNRALQTVLISSFISFPKGNEGGNTSWKMDHLDDDETDLDNVFEQYEKGKKGFQLSIIAKWYSTKAALEARLKGLSKADDGEREAYYSQYVQPDYTAEELGASRKKKRRKATTTASSNASFSRRSAASDSSRRSPNPMNSSQTKRPVTSKKAEAKQAELDETCKGIGLDAASEDEESDTAKSGSTRRRRSGSTSTNSVDGSESDPDHHGDMDAESDAESLQCDEDAYFLDDPTI